MAFPPLPKEAFSVLGPVEVHTESKRFKKSPDDSEDHFGEFNPAARDIHINPFQSEPSKWQTFFHELTHIAICDAGLSKRLVEVELEEVVCDVVGVYLAAALRAGYISINNGNTK